jgi:hypothetical protein
MPGKFDSKSTSKLTHCQGHYFAINGTWGKCELCGHSAQVSVLDLTPQCSKSDLYSRKIESTKAYGAIGELTIESLNLRHHVKNKRVVVRLPDRIGSKDIVEQFNSEIRREVKRIVDGIIAECKMVIPEPSSLEPKAPDPPKCEGFSNVVIHSGARTYTI